MAQQTGKKNHLKVAKGSVAGKTLAEFPILVEQWHPTKNGSLKPRDVAASSSKKVWWKCPKGPDHEWETLVRQRTRQPGGCPFCLGRRLSVTNRLDMVAPLLVDEWDFEKNGELTPNNIACGSSQRVWWRCSKGADHVWRCSPSARIHKGHGCHFCVKHDVLVTHSLAVRNPKLARQWHPTKNGDLTPADVMSRASRHVWWKCPENEDHVWECRVITRALGHGCPFCSSHRASPTNSLAGRQPELARQWHPTKNGDLTPDAVTLHSAKIVWWKCPQGPDHEWDANVSDRARGQGCPFCGTHPKRVSITNSLAACAPQLIAEWHPTKNEFVRPTDVTLRSSFAAWWKCSKGPDHEWKALVYSRTSPKGTGCPFCTGLRVSVTNCLATRFPRVAAQWHPTKNGDLQPDQVHAGSHLHCHWRCVVGHDWVASIANRTARETGCPTCAPRGRPRLMKQKRQETVHIPSYEGVRAGPVKRIR